MAAIERSASATWQGDLKGGTGRMDATSGVLNATPYTFATRELEARGRV